MNDNITKSFYNNLYHTYIFFKKFILKMLVNE